MTSPVSVRPRSAADLDELSRVLRRVHEQDGYPLVWPADPIGWLTRGQQVAAWVAEYAEYAEYAGHLCGHVALSRPHPGEAADAWGNALGVDPDDLLCVATLFVDPEQRGLGAGGRLLTTASQAAAERGLKAVLEVVELNLAAVTLYRAAGWRQIGAVSYDWLPPGTHALLFTGPAA